eukprot:TRINITY_DN853_c0_g2_i2.p1 TRINITY_DN853_c0_g2~~TRINITY_DN853_c0_g2_i2.p1  ORF type:complete len:225 (+),score=17.50 TRINITY_DN853_c0_g2_i2:414-1088(+)
MDGLHQALISVPPTIRAASRFGVRYSGRPAARESSIVFETFAGEIRTQISCVYCGHSVNRNEEFLSLEVALPLTKRGKVQILDELLAAEFGDSQPIADFACQRCHRKGGSVLRQALSRTPNVLVVQLKRFDWLTASRIDDEVLFEQESLDLGKLGRTTRSEKYILFAILNHTGDLSSGHYFALTRRLTGDRTWHSFDDERFKPASEGPGSCLRSAYILFYARKT